MFGNAEANREARACKSLAPEKNKSINKHTLTHTYTNTHTHTHTHTHARTHTHTHARTHAHTHTHTHKHTHIHIQGVMKRAGRERGGGEGTGRGGVARLGACFTFLCCSVHKEKRNASSVTIQLVWHFNEWDFTHRRVWVLIMGSIPYS